jgi:hypothetical protein
MQPEFLPGAGDWKTRRNVLPCNDWLAAKFVSGDICDHSCLVDNAKY